MLRSLVGGDMTSPGPSVETQKVGGSYKLLAGIALIVGVSMVLVIMFSHRGFYNVFRFRQEWLRLEQENVRLAAENDRLGRSIDRLQHDPEYIQDQIRQELNFIKKNELIFQFPPEKPGTAPSDCHRRRRDATSGQGPDHCRTESRHREVSLRTSGRVF